MQQQQWRWAIEFEERKLGMVCVAYIYYVRGRRGNAVAFFISNAAVFFISNLAVTNPFFVLLLQENNGNVHE